MSDPRRTGISRITGKMVSIRHATERDLIEIGEYAGRHRGVCSLEGADVVAAVENAILVGFGILQRKGSVPCITVRDFQPGSGYGAIIKSHLLELACPEQ